MPGHIYVQTGRFEDALKAFEAAGANERHYMDADPLYPHDHYFHNQQYLIYTLGALGRYADAINESRKLMAVPENPGERGALDGTSSYRIGWFSLMRTLVRFEKWDEILDGTTLPLYDKPREAAWYYWARALASTEKDNRAEALQALNNMDRMLGRLKGLLSITPPQLYVARQEAEATIAGDAAAFERVLGLEADMLYTEPPSYPRPFLEFLARRALRKRDFKTAETQYRKLLEREPESGRALWGIAQALAGQQRTVEAQSFQDEFRKAWAHADQAVP